MTQAHVIDGTKYLNAVTYESHNDLQCYCGSRLFFEPVKSGFKPMSNEGQYMRMCGECGETIYYNIEH